MREQTFFRDGRWIPFSELKKKVVEIFTRAPKAKKKKRVTKKK